MDNLLLQALHCKKTARPPVWLMRQAGRYMPQYRALREKYSLEQLFHEPELAAAITRQPLDALGVDAAILFSDILVIAEVFGLSVHFPLSGGPRVEPPVRSLESLHEMRPVRETLSYVFETIRRVKLEIDKPLIGFSGAPFTLASYFIDSGSHESLEHTLRWLNEDPVTFHRLLAKITQAVIAYLKEQVASGVDALQIFDSWANRLSAAQFKQFSLPYLQEIVRAVQTPTMPVILFCRDSSLRVAPLAQLQPAALSFDWHQSMYALRRSVPPSIAVQGNFSPELLHQKPEVIAREVRSTMASMQGETGWIVNLGHGVTPNTPLDHVRCFVDVVKGN